MTVAAIGYLRIGSTDTDAWMGFGTDILGLMDAQREDQAGARFLRMDRQPFRFMIEPGKQDCLLAIGLECRDEHSWQLCCDTLAAAGHKLAAGSAVEAQRRCVSAFVTVQDPSGNTVELYHGRMLDYVPFNSPVGIARFVTGDEYTGDMGFGHAVVPAPATEETITFYTDLLGLGVCDDLRLAMPPDSRVVFMHADNPRQHSLALYNQPHPVGVVHVMVEVETLDDVGRALDRVKQAGLPVLASLGRHVNDNMCSFYVMGPGGIAIEYGYDGLLVDWDNYTPTISTEGDLWGHEYNFPGVND
jgi:3,4-dihydroxy-9,10-secoandrosta-1,3,5(10)-triene-9,17-dione 4,5-dioxygenase